MARNYDDYSDTSSDYGSTGSSRLVLAFILLAVLICIAAVLVWSSIKPVSAPKTEKPAVQTAPEPVVFHDSDFEMPEVRSDYAVETVSEPEPVVYDASASPAVAVSLSDAASGTVRTVKPVSYTEHAVKEGESVAQIAASYGVSIKTIYAVNSIRKAVESGDILIIPDRNGTVWQVSETDTLASIVRQLGLKFSESTLMQLNGLTSDSLVPGTRLFIPSDEYFVSSSSESENSLLSFSLPVSGASVSGLFNQSITDEETGVTSILDGILLSCPVPSDVSSVLSGTVVDITVNDDGTYGIKFSHAGGYTSSMDNLSSVNVSVSERVTVNQIIGTVDSGLLFFKIELDGTPLNPGDFIIK